MLDSELIEKKGAKSEEKKMFWIFARTLGNRC